MSRELDDFLEDENEKVREMIALNLVLQTEFDNAEIGLVTGVPASRVGEIRRGTELIEKRTLEQLDRDLMKKNLKEILNIYKRLIDGEDVDSISRDYDSWKLVNWIHQEIFLENQESKKVKLFKGKYVSRKRANKIKDMLLTLQRPDRTALKREAEDFIEWIKKLDSSESE